MQFRALCSPGSATFPYSREPKTDSARYGGPYGPTNFAPTNPFPWLFMMLVELGNLWNFNQINS